MFKKILSLILCLLMCAGFAGCKKDTENLSVDTGDQSLVSSEPAPTTYINPLTGEDGLDKDTALQRPVAVMVNNISIAQPVQTGLNKADIIYETEVEGSITRLLAVFQDLKSVERVGTVRSARYDYIDLAMGHNAIYVHHGQDTDHASAHLKDVDRFVVGNGSGGVRISNGLAQEHTLYAYGDKTWDKIKSNIKNTHTDEIASPWQTFAREEEPVKFEYTTNTVTVPFASNTKSIFKYDAATGRYTRFFNGTERKDYNTKESVTVKNVFVLSTSITNYPGCNDGDHHKKVYLKSGEGYYFVNGTYTKIKWSKGASSNGFTFTNEDGSPLTVNPGNSWVCIADSSKSQPIIGE